MKFSPKQVFFPVVLLFVMASFYHIERGQRSKKEEKQSMVLLMNQSWDMMNQGSYQDQEFLHDMLTLTSEMRKAELSHMHEFPVDSLLSGFELMDHQIQQSLKASDSTEWVEGYTMVVNACVTCHEHYCPGPINKINNLLKP